MPPPKTFESTSRPYLRLSEYVTVSVAKTTWVCAVSFSNDRRTLRTAGGTGGTGGGSSGASDVDGPSNHPWASTSLSSSSCVRFPAAAITQLPGKYARSCKCVRSSAESALTVSLVPRIWKPEGWLGQSVSYVRSKTSSSGVSATVLISPSTP